MSAREARIAAAIQRSKEDYQPEHAYTERGQARETEDKHGMEHTITQLYFAGDDQGVLDLANSAFKEEKALGGLPREIIDTAMRSSLRSGQSGVKLARSTRSLWKGPSAGIVVVVADCFLREELYREALEPLLISSSQGLHIPVLERLSAVLKELGADEFRADVDGYIQGRETRQRRARPEYHVDLGLDGELLEAQNSTILRLHKDTQDTIKSVKEL